jgi:hypothetical protein
MSAPLPEPKLNPIGEVSYKKAIFHLYDISLCGEKNEFNWNDPFAITLNYKRKFSSEMIMKATMVEMPRLSGRKSDEFEPLREPVSKCFPDVKKGDEITGISHSDDRATFYHNGVKTCDIEWDGFREDFFGIWLSDDSRAPRKSKALRGLKK